MRDNPAQRLHDLLLALRSQPQQLAQTSLAVYFDLAPGDMPGLLESLARAAALPGQIERQLRDHPYFDEAVDLEWKPAVYASGGILTWSALSRSGLLHEQVTPDL